jgi:hypothetical protein
MSDSGGQLSSQHGRPRQLRGRCAQVRAAARSRCPRRPTPEKQANRSFRAEFVREEIAKLPPRQQKMLTLLRFEDDRAKLHERPCWPAASMAPGTSRTRGHEDRAGMVVAGRPELARVAATSPTWACRPGVGPLHEHLDSDSMLPTTSRTRRHTRLNGIRWYQQPTSAGAKPAVARLWPNNRPIAYLVPVQQCLHDLLEHMGRCGDLVDASFVSAFRTSSIASAFRVWTAASIASMPPRTSRTRGHTRPFRVAATSPT